MKHFEDATTEILKAKYDAKYIKQPKHPKQPDYRVPMKPVVPEASLYKTVFDTLPEITDNTNPEDWLAEALLKLSHLPEETQMNIILVHMKGLEA